MVTFEYPSEDLFLWYIKKIFHKYHTNTRAKKTLIICWKEIALALGWDRRSWVLAVSTFPESRVVPPLQPTLQMISAKSAKKYFTNIIQLRNNQETNINEIFPEPRVKGCNQPSKWFLQRVQRNISLFQINVQFFSFTSSYIRCIFIPPHISTVHRFHRSCLL